MKERWRFVGTHEEFGYIGQAYVWERVEPVERWPMRYLILKDKFWARP